MKIIKGKKTIITESDSSSTQKKKQSGGCGCGQNKNAKVYRSNSKKDV